MASTFTTNKHIEKPASGDYNNAWAAPINADWDDIDNALGGHAIISVTGVVAGTYALTLPQYQPPLIQFQGVLSGNLVYALPAGVGGTWCLSNGTTGAFSITFAVTGGGNIVLPQAQNTLVGCNGTVVFQPQTLLTALSQLSGQVTNAQVPQSAVNQWALGIPITMPQVSGVLPIGQAPATVYRGTLGSGHITVQAGGVASGGASGDIFLIY